jgi:hypothetical protein
VFDTQETSDIEAMATSGIGFTITATTFDSPAQNVQPIDLEHLI